MSISDLYASGTHKVRVSHFANIVKMALADNVLTDSEIKFIKRLAKDLGIDEVIYKKVLKDPDSYPLDPSLSHNARIERLYNLTKMILIDGEISDGEMVLLRRITTGLGFPLSYIRSISDEAVLLVSKGINLDSFTKAIKKLNTRIHNLPKNR